MLSTGHICKLQLPVGKAVQLFSIHQLWKNKEIRNFTILQLTAKCETWDLLHDCKYLQLLNFLQDDEGAR